MVKYKGVTLAKNSDAYKMWEDKDFQKLDKHLKELDKNEKALLDRYRKKAV